VSRGLADRGAQAVGIEARNGQESLRAHCVRKDPGERVKRNPGGVLNRIFRPVNNCQASVKEIMVAKAFVGTEAPGAQ
jgi:hypothetical protein